MSATRARMSAYSTIPCPDWRLRVRVTSGYRPRSLTVDRAFLVAGSSQSLLDDHAHHPLAPEVAEVCVVKGFGWPRGDLGSRSDRFFIHRLADHEVGGFRSLEGVR